jgi:GTP-binding protein
MDIKSAEFIKGVIGDDYSMGDELPHVVFLGRSNVGKSSTINTLLGRNSLVRTSSTPGKTREANFFKVNDMFYLVDFPGYGYAKMSHKERDKLIKRILWYLQYSEIKPKLAVLIIDAKLGITELDEEMLEILHANKHPVLILANKIDKLKQGDKVKLERYLQDVVNEDDTAVMFSAAKGTGKDVVLEIIEETLS